MIEITKQAFCLYIKFHSAYKSLLRAVLYNKIDYNPIDKYNIIVVIVLKFINLRLGLLIILAILQACSQPTAEQQVREQLGLMITAIEAQDLGDFMDGIHPSFEGSHQTDWRKLRGLIFFQLQRNRSISVYQWDADITVSDEQATVSIKIVVIGSNKVLPERGRLYNIESNWIKSDAQWRVKNANWMSPEIIHLKDLLL